MAELARPRLTDRVLDIASGGGHVARLFAPLVASVVASDLTPEILEHASIFFAEQGVDNITTQIADAEALPFDARSFDIVTCRIAPHHFPNPAQFVREAARVLEPGGRFILVDSTVPEGPAGEFLNKIEQLRDPSHVRSLTIDEWHALLADAGFQIDAIESFSKRHDFEDWTTRSRMSPADRDALEGLLLEAPDGIKTLLKIEESDGRIVAFTDDKSLFAATLP
jgi:ubiquinone/menaquinone biosynthesis C-methylase UbiE